MEKARWLNGNEHRTGGKASVRKRKKSRSDALEPRMKLPLSQILQVCILYRKLGLLASLSEQGWLSVWHPELCFLSLGNQRLKRLVTAFYKYSREEGRGSKQRKGSI